MKTKYQWVLYVWYIAIHCTIIIMYMMYIICTIMYYPYQTEWKTASLKLIKNPSHIALRRIWRRSRADHRLVTMIPEGFHRLQEVEEMKYPLLKWLRSGFWSMMECSISIHNNDVVDDDDGNNSYYTDDDGGVHLITSTSVWSTSSVRFSHPAATLHGRRMAMPAASRQGASAGHSVGSNI